MQLSQYVWAFVLSAVLLGFFLPALELLLQPHITYLLIILMTLSLLNITLTDIRQSFQHRQVYLVVALTLLTPLLAWFAKPVLDPLSFAGLILATSAPAGISIVFICNLCKGNPSDALSITTLSHLLSIITVPTLLWIMLGETIALDFAAIVLALVKFIAFPFILAQLLGPLLRKHDRIVLSVSTLSLILIVCGIVAPTQAYILENAHAFLLIAGAALICMLAAFITGWFIGKTKTERITYSISASYKNYTLATVIALNLFGELAALAAVAYTIFNNILFALVQFISKH